MRPELVNRECLADDIHATESIEHFSQLSWTDPIDLKVPILRLQPHQLVTHTSADEQGATTFRAHCFRKFQDCFKGGAHAQSNVPSPGAKVKKCSVGVLVQFGRGTRILRVIHGRDARATSANCTSTSVSGKCYCLWPIDPLIGATLEIRSPVTSSEGLPPVDSCATISWRASLRKRGRYQRKITAPMV